MKKTDEKNQIGVWMDHSSAKFINTDGEIKVIQSEIDNQPRIPGESGDGTRLGGFRSSNNEYSKHNKQIGELNSYYNEVYDALKPFQEILVFGPSTAPSEFHNYIINKNKKLNGKIEIRKADYLTDNQLVEFVRNYFNTRNVLS